MNKNILIGTNLNVWSIAKGVGAPSFYKTLELYNNNGFNVFLYTTEKDLDIHELENVRLIYLPKLTEIKSRYLYSLSRTFNYFLYQLIFIFTFFTKQKDPIDIFYGFEIEFVPALKFLSKLKNKKLITRFQGTILAPLINKLFWKIKYFPHYLSLKIKPALTIMTDDGTKGDIVINAIRGNDDHLLFIKNGIDISNVNIDRATDKIVNLISQTSNFDHNFISVSRLQSWKRLDRSIRVFQEFLRTSPNCRYIIVGDGENKLALEQLVKDKKLDESIIFTGGLNKVDINALMVNSDIFLSHYNLSNVGNPLWEALSNECIVVTIANGDTGKIIVDGVNGIISSEDNYLDNAGKLEQLLLEKDKVKEIIANGTITLNESVTSWDDRMKAEYSEVIKFLK